MNDGLEKKPLLDTGRPATFKARPRSKAMNTLKTVGNGVKGLLGIQGDTAEGEKGQFTSSIGVILSMLGCVVGTGNIWRFPRIMATHAEEGGALVFLIVWFMFLILWSIPICLIEYGVGRYTRVSTVESFAKLLGPSYRFLGGFIASTSLFIGAFYSVLLGYCCYYSFFFMATSLPETLETAESHFDDLLNSNWPVFFHILCIILACLAISRGVSTIEPVNRIIVPTLLVIVVFSFYWSLYLPYAGMGIIHMFSPNWKSFGDASLWRDALTQNAWDTGAGGGLFLTYATYMKRSQGAVKLGSTIPGVNNLVSLVCGMTIFCNVFSFEYLKGSSLEEIIDVLKTNGPFNTGITFIQMPLLYGSISGGRVLAILFFLCITLAGLSSLISILELCVHVLEDFGIRRLPATILICVLSGSMGLASALDNEIFVNQDAVWAQALIVSGCILLFLVMRYGVLKFRIRLYNSYGIGDWSLPWVWVFVVLFVCPIEGIGMLIWWVVDEMINNSDPYYPNTPWWEFNSTSLIMVFTQWILVISLMIALNWWMKPITRKNVIELNTSSSTKFEKIKDFLIRLFIRYEQVKIELPPGLDDTPTVSEATTIDEDGHHSDDIPLKNSGRKPTRESKISFRDDEL